MEREEEEDNKAKVLLDVIRLRNDGCRFLASELGPSFCDCHVLLCSPRPNLEVIKVQILTICSRTAEV